MRNDSGNALFLILIAVALFAALSYAVTQSGRGGSGVDKEQAEIYAAQILQELGRFQAGMMRLKITGGYDQILFNDSAATTSGTCYYGGTTSTPCNTVGLFSADGGLNKPMWSEEWRDPSQSGSTLTWGWQHRQVQVNGAEVGTSAPDAHIILTHVALEICKALNRKLNGSETIGGVATGPAGAGHGISFMTHAPDGTMGAITSITGGGGGTAINYPNPGCSENGSSSRSFAYVLEEN